MRHLNTGELRSGLFAHAFVINTNIPASCNFSTSWQTCTQASVQHGQPINDSPTRYVRTRPRCDYQSFISKQTKPEWHGLKLAHRFFRDLKMLTNRNILSTLVQKGCKADVRRRMSCDELLLSTDYRRLLIQAVRKTPFTCLGPAG